jgi:hypothetical protein
MTGHGRTPGTNAISSGVDVGASPPRSNELVCSLAGNAKGFAVRFLGGTCDLAYESCGHLEPPQRDADQALGMRVEPALIREAGARRDLRAGEVAASSRELLGPLDAADDDVLVRRQSGGLLELPGEVVGVEVGDSGAGRLAFPSDGPSAGPRARGSPPRSSAAAATGGRGERRAHGATVAEAHEEDHDRQDRHRRGEQMVLIGRLPGREGIPSVGVAKWNRMHGTSFE